MVYESLPRPNKQLLDYCAYRQVESRLTDKKKPKSIRATRDSRSAGRHRSPGKFLFLSGYTSDIIDSHGMSEEGLNFISKAALPEEIPGKIREILNT
jgi:hypothetical protein